MTLSSSSSSSGPPHANCTLVVSNFSREKSDWESYLGGGEKQIPKSFSFWEVLSKNGVRMMMMSFLMCRV